MPLAPKNGQRVSYRDPNGNVQHGEDTVATGICNGDPYVIDDVDPPVSYYPIWTDRDKGRESTTIIVHEANILSVDDA